MILLIDHFDSFVHNLSRYFIQLGCESTVIRYDKITPDKIRRINPSYIVLSPGPCSPAEAPISVEIVKQFFNKIPILGVCLGHQIIAAAFGAKITRAKLPLHGKSSLITHQGRSIMSALPQPLRVGRYHSLIVSTENFPQSLEVLASSEEGEIMALQHKGYPTIGVQFHPESVLTDGAYQLLKNFLALQNKTLII